MSGIKPVVIYGTVLRCNKCKHAGVGAGPILCYHPDVDGGKGALIQVLPGKYAPEYCPFNAGFSELQKRIDANPSILKGTGIKPTLHAYEDQILRESRCEHKNRYTAKTHSVCVDCGKHEEANNERD